MKRISLLFLILTLIGCGEKKSNEKTEPTLTKIVIPERLAFGFNLNDFTVVDDTIRKGDTFGAILGEQNLGGLLPFEVVEKVRDSFDVRLMRVGKPYTLLQTKDAEKKLQVFIYQPDRLNYYILDLRDSVSVKKITRPVTIKRRTIAGKLDGSLSEALADARVEASLAARISKIYQWSIDFFKLQKGDKFAITFTERFINDSIYDGVDSLEASFFEYKGQKIYAFPYSQNPGREKIDYYDAEGKPLKNFFLKAPLKFSRISSKFSPRRFHPVQSVWKAHKGTDYAAPTGTPIMSTAAGTVELAGYTAGNGNFVKVKHNGTYSTQYLHMSKILVRKGQRVTQGQVIGKVGSTGLATGPHVCYRFWKNGVQVDALKMRLPSAMPMESKYKERYLAQIKPLKQELDSVANLH